MLEPINKYAQNLLPWIFKRANKNNSLNFQQVAVHPCIINGEPYVVYPKGLREQSPELFQRLKTHFEQRGYKLKEDQRSGKSSSGHHHERRRWVPALLFTASLLFEGAAHAEVDHHAHNHDHAAHQNHNVELYLVPNEPIRDEIRQATRSEDLTEATKFKNKIAQRLFNQMRKHYKKQESDPDYILEDFKQIANYYSQFPEVVALLSALEKKNWELQYDRDNWVTVASGNIFEVKKAVIHFNTRAAAQLRLNNGCKQNPVCIASPADALLHELLHTYSMLINTEEFIAQGGMNNLMYPYKHEYSIIKQERNLYTKMSMTDTVKRPHRVDHTGRLVRTSCPTCIY